MSFMHKYGKHVNGPREVKLENREHDWDLAKAIRRSGFNDVEIARQFRTGLATVRLWRRGEGMPMEPTRGKLMAWLRESDVVADFEAAIEKSEAIRNPYVPTVPERVRVEDFENLLETCEKIQKTAAEREKLAVELGLEKSDEKLRDSTAELIVELKATIARMKAETEVLCVTCGESPCWCGVGR